MSQISEHLCQGNEKQDLNAVLLRYEQRPRKIELLKRYVEDLEQEQEADELLLARATEPVFQTASTFRYQQKAVGEKPLGLGYEYQGKFVRCVSQIDAYVGALRAILELLSAEGRQKVFEAMNRITSKHPELAESPDALFPNQRGSIKVGQWKQVLPGLVCYAVLDGDAKKKRLKKACRAAGLKYDIDVKLVGF